MLSGAERRQQDKTLRRQAAELLQSIAYGDAAGLPVETKSAEDIQAKHGVIEGLLPSLENDHFKLLSGPGYWSDDTQLSRAVMDALVQADGFDLRVMADLHVKAYLETETIFRNNRWKPRGWGGSTVEAMERLRDGISPFESGTFNGGGNGVLMKLAPLALWQTLRKTPTGERYKQYDQLTTMTHDSDVARMTTRVHGDMLRYLLQNDYTKNGFIDTLNRSIETHESHMGTEKMLSDKIAFLSEPLTKEAILQHSDRKGFYAPQTLLMAYGAFMLHDGAFRQSVYEAVNLGGDTDSTASIVAAMNTFKTKESVQLPPDHTQIDRLDELNFTSRRFAQAAFRF